VTVSVIIPVYGRDDVFATIALLRQTESFASLRLVLIDNGNTPERRQALSALATDRLEVLRLEENRGGSGGYIAGMKHVLAHHPDSELVWLLDDDARPNENTLPGLLRAYDLLLAQDAKIACIGSTIVREATPDTIAECGAWFLQRRGWIKLNLAGEKLTAHRDEILPVEYSSACSCLVPRTALERCGVWEDMFIHYDDIEWCLRAQRKHGLQSFATTMSVVSHPEVLPEKHGSWVSYYGALNELRVLSKYSRYILLRRFGILTLSVINAAVHGRHTGESFLHFLVWRDFLLRTRRLRPEVERLLAAARPPTAGIVPPPKERMRAVLVDLLVEFDRVCRKRSIRYFLDGGTLLGAVRHKGFIPWDDDVDVIMTRDEYRKLCACATEEFRSPYFWQNNETDPGSLRGHAQLRNARTTGILKQETCDGVPLHRFNQGMFLDVFILDRIPNDDAEYERFAAELAAAKDRPFFLRECKRWGRHLLKGRLQSPRYAIRGLYYLLKDRLTGTDSIAAAYRTFDSLVRKYENDPTARRCSSISFLPLRPVAQRFPASMFEETCEVSFEGRVFPAPREYDAYLRALYGEWQVPVVAENMHGEVLMDTERPYTDYLGK